MQMRANAKYHFQNTGTYYKTNTTHSEEREKNTTKPPSQDAIQTITVLLNNTIYITTAVLSRAKNSMNKHAHTSCSKSF